MMNLKLKEAKIFKDTSNKLTFVNYNPDTDDYFNFIAEQCNKRQLNQVIITSNIMIILIFSLVEKYKFCLERVEFMNDDDTLDNEIQNLVNNINNEENFFFLLNKLQLLSYEQSIDILKIHLKKRYEHKSTQIKIQANGIFFIDKSNFDKYSQKILDIVSYSKANY